MTMPLLSDRDIVIKWTEIMLTNDPAEKELITKDWKTYSEKFRLRLSEYLYEDMRRARVMITAPFSAAQEFAQLSGKEKQIWYDYVDGIPHKLKSLKLFIKPFTEFCRTCIITDEEIEKLASIDHENLFLDPAGHQESDSRNEPKKKNPRKVPYKNIPDARKWFYRELNYLIPAQLKKTGFEIVRPEELTSIDTITIRKLSRAIHSRYLQEIRKSSHNEEITFTESFPYPGDQGIMHDTEYDSLPDDIKISNKDNAYHIPTKLLAIGYRIRQVQKGFKPMTLRLNNDEIEIMARIEHLRWSWDKRLNGWIYGNIKDNNSKIHPGLISYEDLAESEKEKDRELVRLIPALLHDINFEAYPVNTEKVNLSYSIRPHSSIHKLLNETQRLNEEIRVMAVSLPEINDKISIINKKIAETINEVQGSYNYAHYIQKTFLPDDLFVRECFPDSFVLSKPKDIVGGDFYFFGHSDHQKIFAAADCTGHGIPGAMLSTIGYGITDQAVNELQKTNPSDILEHLYSKVHRFLRWDEDETGMSDDMDIVMCNLDEKTSILTYSSVRMPFYHIRGNEITEITAINYTTRFHNDSSSAFLSRSMQLKQGDTIYLCSDGYTDQFGGLSHRKYMRSRFKTFLLSICDLTMTEQCDRLYEEIEHWREENNEDQTDDILVIGIKI
jgi:serine phosphatase RsbU (regulator of sigma subunit)